VPKPLRPCTNCGWAVPGGPAEPPFVGWRISTGLIPPRSPLSGGDGWSGGLCARAWYS